MGVYTMTAKSVQLNWDNCSEQLIDTLKKLWTDEGFTDVTLVFDDGQTIGVNSTLLAAISPIFKNAIRGRHNQNPYFFMFNMDSMSIKSLLQFIFGGEVHILETELDKFMETARKLKVTGFSYKHTKDYREQKDETMEVNYDVNAEEENATLDESLATNEDLYSPSDENYFNDSKEVVEENSSTLENHNRKQETNSAEIHPLSANEKVSEESPMNIEKKVSEKLPLFGHWNSKAMEAIVKEEEGLLCFLCKKRDFRSLDELYDHEKIYHSSGNSGREVKDYKCDECGLSFHRQLLLKQHIRKEHTEIVPGSNVCNICGKNFKSEKQMAKHREYSHPIPGMMFKCKLCPKESMTKNASNVHYYQAHTTEERKAFEGKI